MASAALRNLCLVQPNYGTGSGQFTCEWLPYSVGCLWAYASQFEDLAASYALTGLYFKRSPIDEVVRAMDEPAVVGFSNYVWNINYNRALARAVKQRWPRAVLVFGGPEVPDDPRPLFASDPWLDVTVHKEGEIAFTSLLRALLAAEPDLSGIPGIFYRSGTGIVCQPGTGRIDALDTLPSPYGSGVFEAIVRENPDTQWAATYETNRGCPFKCHFCDWGSAIFSKVKRFPEGRVFADLDWLADNKVEYVFVADANFGIFKERDDTIADRILEAVDRTGYPRTFCIQWTKNSNEDVVRMARKLSPVQKGLTLSVQSMTDGVLEAVERRNMAINDLGEILALCNEENLPSYTELILGLPGETLESWKENFHKLLELGQHCAVDVWIAQVLQNSELNHPREIELHQLETVQARDYFTGCDRPEEIPECIRLVRSTKSLPFEDFIDAYMYAWMILNFHLYGWTQFAARFMQRFTRMGYEAFYARLFDFIRSDRAPILRDEYEQTRRRIVHYMTTGEIEGNLADTIGVDIEIFGHNLLWLSQMVFRYQGREVFEELRPFLESLGDCMDGCDASDLVAAQENSLVFFGVRYPKEFTLRSNLVEAVLRRAPLTTSGVHRYRADYRPEIRAAVRSLDEIGISDFLYMLYYKRRMGPGMTAIESVGHATIVHA